ncbi:MAG: hypothetical protein ACM3OC_09955 [Deltaproteobacteria bacterium]
MKIINASLLCFLLPFLLVPPASAEDVPAEELHGFYGGYPLGRESSGTSWQPQTTPVAGISSRRDDLTFLYHGFANGGYIIQQGKRGDDGFFTTSMISLASQYPVEDGILGTHFRFSLDPYNGSEGYPLLLRTGGTDNGRDRLLDHQQPNDLFSELAASYSFPLSEASWGFVYAGYPGEPALGPPLYTERFSSRDIPVAPLSYNWMDRSHSRAPTVTAGYTNEFMKLDASVFNGREPDKNHWNLNFNPEQVKFKSYSGRVAFNLSPVLTWDLSLGRLEKPLEPRDMTDIIRATSFVSLNSIGDGYVTQISGGYGWNNKQPGPVTAAYLLELTTVINKQHTYFGRVERVDQDELFPGGPMAEKVFTVYEVQAGYIRDFPIYKEAQWGVGWMLIVDILPSSLEDAYGSRQPLSAIVFARVKL